MVRAASTLPGPRTFRDAFAIASAEPTATRYQAMLLVYVIANLAWALFQRPYGPRHPLELFLAAIAFTGIGHYQLTPAVVAWSLRFRRVEFILNEDGFFRDVTHRSGREAVEEVARWSALSHVFLTSRFLVARKGWFRSNASSPRRTR